MQGPILIVDNAQDVLERLTAALSFVDTDVTALNSAGAADLYLQERINPQSLPRIIILDVSLGAGDAGWALAKKIRAAGSLSECKNWRPAVVMLTASKDERDIDPAMIVMSQADALVEKPIHDWGRFRDILADAYDKRYPEKPAERAAQQGGLGRKDDYLKAIVIFVLAGLALWSISNRISDARWQGEMQGQLKSDQRHTEQLLKIMKDDVDMSWAYVFLLRDQMRESGLKPPSIPKRPNYSDELEK